MANYYKLNEAGYPMTYSGAFPLDDTWNEFKIGENGVYSIQELQDAIDNEKLKQTQAEFRLERDKLLGQVDIEINKGLDNGIDVSALRAYRQELRDATIAWVLPTHP